MTSGTDASWGSSPSSRGSWARASHGNKNISKHDAKKRNAEARVLFLGRAEVSPPYVDILGRVLTLRKTSHKGAPSNVVSILHKARDLKVLWALDLARPIR